MLFLPVGASKPVRVQGTFVTDEEIGAVLSFIKSTSSTQYDEEMIAEMERRAVAEKGSKKGSDDDGDTGGALDPMFEQAVECVIDAGQHQPAAAPLQARLCSRRPHHGPDGAGEDHRPLRGCQAPHRTGQQSPVGRTQAEWTVR